VNYVEVALQGILSRVERGMTVELRLCPPRAAEQDKEAAQAFEDLKALQRQLVFPPATSEPAIAIPKMADRPKSKGRKRPPPPTTDEPQ
jgi:hypothetical protein